MINANRSRLATGSFLAKPITVTVAKTDVVGYALSLLPRLIGIR